MDKAEKERVKLAITDRMDELNLILGREASSEILDDNDEKLHQLAFSTVDKALAEASAREMQSLSRSLQWLESEDGGYCETCGCEIASARLVAMPSARTCIDCKKKEEA